ncbi:MAG TPA: methyltransferase [Sphingomicrobium sp.]|nr:methyltransferase [Sphingomicrobium sp.]
MHRLARLAAAVTLMLPLACSRAAPPDSGSVIQNAVNDPARPAAWRTADALRKPAETLEFSGVRPGMIVGEFYPAGGYFTRMLSDVVGSTGHVYAIENAGWNDSVKDDRAMLAEGKWTNVSLDVQPFGTVKFAKPLDLAWVTQNYHDLKIDQYGPGGRAVDTAAFDRAVYHALKPGGTFFIIDHQGPAGMSEADIAKMHRIDRDTVVREVTSAGFKLVGEGTFLHRPGDDHTKPIFDPSIRGHTDQYALKFEKPR